MEDAAVPITEGPPLKAAILLFASPESPEGTGRMANALTIALELLEGGDEVRLVFDGAGVQWIPRLVDPAEKYSRLFERIRPAVMGACLYCLRAYGMKDAAEAAEIPVLKSYKDHPSVRDLMADGFQIITL